MTKRAILLAMLSFAGVTPVFAGNTISVCPNTQYPTIQSGVNAATPGSTIQVCPGTFAEQVTINKSSLILQGQRTIVTEPATSNLSYGFMVNASNVQITGFQITGFKDHSGSAGIYVNHASGTQITSDVIYGNCNGIIVNQGTNTAITSDNISQNPFPDPSAIVPQSGIPEPSQPVPNSCVTFAVDQNFQQILGPDGYAVQTAGGGRNQVDRNDVEQNGQCGIQLIGDSGGSEVSRNTLFANNGTLGPCGNVDVRSSPPNSTDIQIGFNSINAGSNGVMLVNANKVEVSQNSITRTNNGIVVTDSNHNQVDHNNVNNNFSIGISLTGQFNEIDHNNASNNGVNGIVVSVDGCPFSGTGGVFLNTWANTIDHNNATGNGQGNGNIDAEDFSNQSGTACNPPPAVGPSTPPPGNYTPGTFDFWDHNNCGASIPSGLCK